MPLPDAAKKYLAGLVLLLLGGTAVGWLYGHVAWGLLGAALLGLGWHAYRLLSFERALHTGDFEQFRYRDGIWERLFSRFRFERERAGRRKKEYRLLLREIRKSTNAMPDGAVILDTSNEIIACNRASKMLAGLKRKKDRGQRVDNIIRDPALTELLQRDNPKQTAEIHSPVMDDGWLSCRVVPYGADQRLLILRDVTESVRINKMRRDFIANASHELRSPLTVISGYLDAMGDDPELPDTWRQPVAQMRRQAVRMRQLIGELLELSRVESKGPAKTHDAVDVVALINAAREALGGTDGVAEIAVRPESAALLRGNPTEIETVITNLLSNAIRYTPSAGSITVTWRSDEHGADLVVADTGEGIDPDDIPRLTERFFRADRGRNRDDGGVGLGLAIVKHILTRHDAELQVDSKLGAGSEFRCHFPRERLLMPERVAVS